MLFRKVEAGNAPKRVSPEKLPDNRKLVRLADHIAESDPQEDGAKSVRYDEVCFDLPEGRKEETEADIESNFAEWWEYGASDESKEITIEERVAALEEIILMGLEVQDV